MTKLDHTMAIDNDAGIEQTLARGVSLDRALRIAIEHDGAGEATVSLRNLGKGRLVSIGRRLAANGAFECLAFAFMPLSRLPHSGEDHAQRSFERKLLDNKGVFWSGRVETDADYAHRTAARRA